MNMKSRIIDFVKSQKMSIREFERVCNFPNGTIGAFKNDINNKRRVVIFEKFPQLNTKWLLTGEVEMLNHLHNEATHNINSSNNTYINGVGDNSQDKTNEKNIYNEMIITQRELIDSLKEQITQYRKEIEYLKKKIKDCNENNGK